MEGQKSGQKRGRDADNYGRHGSKRGGSGGNSADPYSALEPRVVEKLQGLFRDNLCSEQDFDAQALGQLAQFPPYEGEQIVEEFRDASSVGTDIRNKCAYLMGIMKKYRQGQGSRQRRQGSGRGGGEVSMWLDRLAGKFSLSDVDERCRSTFDQLPEPAKAEVLAEVASKSSLDDVRNMSAFLMGIIKKYQHRGPPRGGPPNHSPGPHGGGMGFPPMDPPHMFNGPGLDMQLNMNGLSPGGPPLGQPFHAPLGPPMAPQLGKAQREHHGLAHVQWGVRVDEFHGLSVFAQYVHPAAALKLQQLWDRGNRLVSLLDDRSWEELADLNAADGVAVVEEVADALKFAPNDLHNVNTIFQSAARNRAAGLAPLPMSSAAGPAPMQRVGNPGGPAHAPQLPHGQGPPLGGPPFDPFGAQSLGPSPQPQPLGLALQGFGPNPGAGRPPFAPQQFDPSPNSIPVPFGGNGGAGQRGRNDGDRRGREPRQFREGDFGKLSPEARQAVDAAVASSGGRLTVANFDAGVIDTLTQLSEADALSILAAIGAEDWDKIDKPTPYIMGMIRRRRNNPQHATPPRAAAAAAAAPVQQLSQQSDPAPQQVPLPQQPVIQHVPLESASAKPKDSKVVTHYSETVPDPFAGPLPGL